MPESRERWGGRAAFVMAAIGSAVGLGNVWRFPYTAFSNGGGAFLIPYFVALLTAGIPIMIVEYALGQRFQRGAPEALARTRPWFRWVGWFAILVGLTITFYYVVIMSYSWHYMFASPTVAWTKPAPVVELDKTAEDWTRITPATQIVLYHRCQSEKERARLQAIEDLKPEDRRIAVLLPDQRKRLEAEELKKQPQQRMTYVALDDNIANYFLERGLGGFRKSIWTAKARHNMAIDFAERIRAASETLLEGGIDRMPARRRVAAFVSMSGEQEANRDLVNRLAHWNTRHENLNDDIEAILGGAEAKRKPYLGDMFTPNWRLVFWNAVTWIVIFVIVASGVRNVGRVVMITVPLPVILLLVLLLRGVTLEGAAEGIRFYLTPNWNMLANPSVWIAAYGQVFFSLTLGFGTLIAYASYMPDDSDISNNAFITSFANCATSFFAGFAVFSTLGYLAYVKGGVPVAEVAESGPGLAFLAYPTALAQLPGMWAPLVGSLFFLCLLFLGIDSAFSLIEGTLTGVADFVKRHKVAITADICALGFLMSTLFATRSGLMWLDIVDNWMNNYGLVIVGLLECVAVSYFADFGKLRAYINERSEIHLDAWFDLFVRVITPGVLIYLLGAQFGRDVQKVYGGYDTVLSWSVSLAGWGWIFCLILVSLVLSRDWIAFSWVAGALAIFGLFRLGLDTGSSAMGALGMTLLFGGLITCLWVALRRRPPRGEQALANP